MKTTWEVWKRDVENADCEARVASFITQEDAIEFHSLHAEESEHHEWFVVEAKESLSPEVQALIQVARLAQGYIKPGAGTIDHQLAVALAPFTESAPKPLTPTIEEALREFVKDIDQTGGLVKADCDGSDAGGYFAPSADPEWVDLGDTYLKACAALNHTPVFEDEEAEAEFKVLSAAPVE